MFYTSVELFKNEILYRGINSQGKRVQEKINFSPVFYIPSNDGEYRDLYNTTSLEEKKFKKIWDARNYIKDYEEVEGYDVYGQDNFATQFIHHTYPNEIDFNINKISVANIDIETTCEDGFPDVKEARETINVLTYYESVNDVYYCFTNKEFGDLGEFKFKNIESEKYENKNVQIFQCENEKELLLMFLLKWRKYYPNIITGWNIEMFDVPYLINRMVRVLGEEKTEQMSPWGMIYSKKVIPDKGAPFNTYIMKGISVVDYIKLYKDFSFTPRERYSLDYISQVELGEKKLEYEGAMHLLYKNDYQKFVEYNIQDVFLVQNIEYKRKLLEFIITMTYMAKINYEDCFSSVRTIESLCYGYLLNNKMVPKVKGNKSGKNEDYGGGFVKEPIPNKYDCVASFDLNSLYPSIMQQLNLSPETFKPDYFNGSVSVDSLLEEKLDLSYAKEKNITVAASGHHFTKDKEGFIPSVISNLIGTRKKIKKDMLMEEKRLEDINIELEKRGLK